ncbi:MAG TPA: DUF5703 domain-containing protein [Phnomibacter sp.]|nr:DUF5703 domain-containing protein [Phnomibacter sp.]
MKRVLIGIVFLLASFSLQAQTDLSAYDIVWNNQSKNASESMPCGGGDIGMNVWVEKGEVFIYVARSGNFDENNALFKTGRIRLKLSPNPFEGKTFMQQLHLKEGFVTVEGEQNGVKASVKIWADVFKPVAHFDINSDQKISVEAAYESWRYQDRVVTSRENFANSWKWGAPKNNVYKKDEIAFSGNEVLFYHHNSNETIFDVTVKQQGMDSVKDQLYNPLKQLAFGGLLSGKNFVAGGNDAGMYAQTDFKAWKLKSKTAAKQHALQLVLHNAQVDNIETWKQSLVALQQKANADKNAFQQTQQWWSQFWSRSFIAVDPQKNDLRSWEVGRNYQLFRYMLALNTKGDWPTKFNGGLLTVDPCYTDTVNKNLTPDYRNWGGGLHTAQNQRLVYFPMVKAGDWDLMQPQLNFYLRLQKNAELRSKFYWNHAGACFTEQMENFGLPNYAEYGIKRPDYFDKGVEYNAWLEYEWDTVFEFCLMMLEEENYTGRDISDRVSFIESCLRFFDEHYQYLAKQRGARALDGKGQLVLYPGSGAETFKMANNSTSTIAALQTITKKLQQLPANYLTSAQRSWLDSLQHRIPPINFENTNGHTTLAPAKTWERINNTESSQLYPVFPWGVYGVGKPGLDTAINTWRYDTNAIKFRSHIGWKQDNIWAARLGLADEAWKLTALKLQNSERRFPAFWGPGYDWVPDHNWGGSGMIGLQEMLLQTDDKRILLFAGWPKEKDVHFKLHAPHNTTVEAELKNGKLVSLIVLPESRKQDVEIMLP